MVEEMCRRVAISDLIGRKFLAEETRDAKLRGGQVDMACIAWDIKKYSDEERRHNAS
jgi:hypothetical protein